MEKEIELSSGITLKSLIFGVVFSVLIVAFLVSSEFYAFRAPILKSPGGAVIWPAGPLRNAVGGNVAAGTFIFASILGMFIIPVAVSCILPKKHRFTMQELTFIYAMVSSATVINGLLAFSVFGVPWNFFTRPDLTENAVKYASLLMPGNNLAEAQAILLMAEAGGTTVPWGNWIPIAGIYMFLFISFFFFMNFGGALLRPIWVDTESLNFPYSKVVNELIQRSKGEGGISLLKDKLLWAGVAVSFILGFINGGLSLFDIPDTPPLFVVDLYPYAFESVGVPYFAFEPWILGLGLLLTRDVLISTVIAFIGIEWIVPYAWVALGWWDPTTRAPSVWPMHNWHIRMAGAAMAPARAAGVSPGLTYWFFFGMMLALVYYPLLRHRRVLIDAIRAAMKGEGEGSLYRLVWIGWLLTGAVFIVGLMFIGMEIHWALLTVAFLATFHVGITRVFAETGLFFGGWSTDYMIGWEFTCTSTTLFRSGGYKYAYPWVAVDGLASGWVGIGGMQDSVNVRWTMDSYSLAGLTRTKWKGPLSGNMIATAIGICIAVPLYLTLLYSGGYTGKRIPHYGASFINDNLVGKGVGGSRVPYGFSPDVVGSLIAGIVMAVVLFVGRGRIGLFRQVSVAGLVGYGAMGLQTWFPYLIAFIVQAITLRIGGTELYRKKVVPLAVGLILGIALLWLVLCIGWTWRGIAGIAETV